MDLKAKILRSIRFTLWALIALWSSFASSAPLDLTYGGRLVESNGKPVSGPVDISVSFYQSESGNDPIAVTIPHFAGVTNVSHNVTYP